MCAKKPIDYSIRPAEPCDVSRILAFWRQADATPSATDNESDLHRALVSSATHVLLAETTEMLVGSILGTFDGWRGNIYRMAVHPDYRRLGIGRALVAQVDGWLKRQGAKRVTALVEKDHHWATGFWISVGYGVDQRIARHVRTL